MVKEGWTSRSAKTNEVLHKKFKIIETNRKCLSNSKLLSSGFPMIDNYVFTHIFHACTLALMIYFLLNFSVINFHVIDSSLFLS